MTLTLPTRMPALLVAGDTWNWEDTFPDFPISDGWDQLEYHLRGIGVVDIANGAPKITNDGTTWTTLLAPADTSGVAAGMYRWMARVTASAGTYIGQKHTVRRGTVIVKSDLTGAADQDADEIILTKIVQEITARIPGSGAGHVRSMVDNLELWKVDMDVLEKLRSKYEARVWRKRHPGQLGPRMAFRL